MFQRVFQHNSHSLTQTIYNMKYAFSSALGLAAAVNAAPSRTLNAKPRQAGACASAVTLDASTNVFSSHTLHANNFYRAEIEAAAANMISPLKEQALKVADVGSFVWM